jgi:hypothetical protein
VLASRSSHGWFPSVPRLAVVIQQRIRRQLTLWSYCVIDRDDPAREGSLWTIASFRLGSRFGLNQAIRRSVTHSLPQNMVQRRTHLWAGRQTRCAYTAGDAAERSRVQNQGRARAQSRPPRHEITNTLAAATSTARLHNSWSQSSVRFATLETDIHEGLQRFVQEK